MQIHRCGLMGNTTRMESWQNGQGAKKFFHQIFKYKPSEIWFYQKMERRSGNFIGMEIFSKSMGY